MVLVGAAAPVVASAAGPAPSPEGIQVYTPGTSAVVKGTRVLCITTQTSVTCEKPGGLVATLTKKGTVQITKGPGQKFSPRWTLAVYGGFNLTGAPIYCHVYPLGKLPTMTCSVVDPKGGLPNTRGFDMNDQSVVLFGYPSAGNRKDIKTVPQA
jgi:hypothetical protein